MNYASPQLELTKINNDLFAGLALMFDLTTDFNKWFLDFLDCLDLP